MIKLVLLSFTFFIALQQCSSKQSSTQDVRMADDIPVSSNYKPSLPLNNGSLKPFDCEKCTYVLPRKHVVDGAALGFKPGDFICLDASIEYGPLKFINLKGTPGKPITIVNCGGPVLIDVPGKSFVIKTENSEHFRITSIGNANSPYGIKLTNGGLGLTLDRLSTNFEVDHIEVYNIGFAGIMAKTDPSCDDATIRENFTMHDIALHDNYVHDTGGEGFYIGNSFYNNGVKRKECGVRLPHAIHGVKVFNNIVKNSGWESIQVGSAVKGAEVYNNIVENYGVKDRPNQRGGIQLGEGTGGLCYNNKITTGKGNGLIVLGYGDNLIFNNIICNAGLNAIFCDERFTEGPGFKFINNTIINPKKDGIKIYADLVRMNVIVNNIIVNPGSYEEYAGLNSLTRTKEDAYVYKLNSDVKIDLSDNYFTLDINELKFTDPEKFDFTLTKSSPAIDKGRNVSSFHIDFDFLSKKRPQGSKFDIGAYEH